MVNGAGKKGRGGSNRVPGAMDPASAGRPGPPGAAKAAESGARPRRRRRRGGGRRGAGAQLTE